ncbi:MAG: TraR/DksA family transcriptional regulator [Chitinophagales bacterium]
MLTEDQKQFIKKKIMLKLKVLEEDITFLEENTRPISPENAIGRVSRMDAINNKSVAEDSLRKSKEKYVAMKEALSNIDNEDFDKCQKCKDAIDFKRIAFLPESRRCAKCAR